jgi:hypothetical protein
MVLTRTAVESALVRAILVISNLEGMSRNYVIIYSYTAQQDFTI